MTLNYFSPIRLTLALLPGLIERGGRIVNISSVAARLGPPGEAAYSATKAALTAFTESMAVDLRDTDVLVHLVNPGVIDTDLFHLPDNDEGFHAAVDALPVEAIVQPVIDQLDSGTIEIYVPEWFQDISAGKFANPNAFIEGTKEYAALPDRLRQANASQFSRAGRAAPRVIFWYSGWKLKYPEMCEPTCDAVRRAMSASMSTGVPAASAMQLGLTRALHRDEPPHRFVDRVPDGEQPVVAQDRGLVVAERVGDALALLGVEHDAGVVVEQRVVVVERADVLGQRVEEPAERRPRLAVHRVRVGGRDHVGPGGVDLRVDRERGAVDRRVALDDLALVVDQDQVGDPDVAEVHAERVDPEVVEVLGVAGRDVAGDALVEAEPAEQPERRRPAAACGAAARPRRVSNCGR